MWREIHFNVFPKPFEWVIAVKLLNVTIPKEEILSMYLNKFDFLNNAVVVSKLLHIPILAVNRRT